MELPNDLKYTEDHEWVRVEDDTVTLGITAHAQEALGDIVYFEAPAIGDAVTAGDAFCVVESVKAVSDVYSPIDGEIVAVNEGLEDAPEAINTEPYGGGWLVKIKLSDTSQIDGLLDASAYTEFLADA